MTYGAGDERRWNKKNTNHEKSEWKQINDHTHTKQCLFCWNHDLWIDMIGFVDNKIYFFFFLSFSLFLSLSPIIFSWFIFLFDLLICVWRQTETIKSFSFPRQTDSWNIYTKSNMHINVRPFSFSYFSYMYIYFFSFAFNFSIGFSLLCKFRACNNNWSCKLKNIYLIFSRANQYTILFCDNFHVMCVCLNLQMCVWIGLFIRSPHSVFSFLFFLFQILCDMLQNITIS